MKNSITAVILTKNEEKNIVDCLESLYWCDERVIIDDFSEDRTVEIVERNGGKVFRRTLHADFAAQRNFGIEKAKGDWILFVDADERVSKKLQEEIAATVKNEHCNGYLVRRSDYLWNKELLHGETGGIQLLRLGKKGKGEWVGKVHEVWAIKGSIGTLTNAIQHYPHPTIKEFLEELNTYTDIRARELFKKGKRTNLFSIMFYTKGKFFMNYIIKLGFLDGVPGLLHAMLMSFHSFLVRSKLWFLYEKEKQKG